VPEMAPDEPMPRRDSPGPDWALRVRDHMVHGGLFLLHYLAEVDDNVPPMATEHAGRPITTGSSPSGVWAHNCAEELLRLRPSDAPDTAKNIMAVGAEWAVQAGKAGGGPSFAAMYAGAGPLLEPLCPPAHLDAAREILHEVYLGMERDRLASLLPNLARFAAEQPVALKDQDIVLIKASRSVGLEKFGNLLQSVR